ncbi:hypothetical protein RB614_11075 [Phytohabitans sp. ZYX-F-186]|uniref:Uncharacterized protein n=1 Tax=Phytohabitans maris TaxID=3071409 RepID=A0ABU0ZDL4_9ACTN|nr:hypothetical protein [Phytohabitans sp. ZYX-F-186]MDQ7905063.1 hypothetical protein [Phytohabitans sp. ZYX-F-186]
MTDGSAFTDWLVSDNWQDYRQQRAIRELGDEVSSLSSSLYSQQRESSRLRSELSKLQGSVEMRLDRLTRAFDAFVELSDLRMTLAMFDPPALVRHRTRQVIAAVSQGERPPPADFADVPGYWLAPATTALVALLGAADATFPHGEAPPGGGRAATLPRDEHGTALPLDATLPRGERDEHDGVRSAPPGGGDADAALALAVERDPVRTALLLTLTAAVDGRADLGARWLPEALGPLPVEGPVSRAVRTLWTEAALGRFGAQGRALLDQRLAALVDALDPEREKAAAEAWRARIDALPGIVPRPQSILEPVADAEAALAAGARLAVLRELCARPPAEPAPADADPLAGLLRALVDEGSAEEAPLLGRAAELRAVIEGRQYTADEQWAAPAGTALELLLADAFTPDGTPLARAARTAGARWLLTGAERLAGDAATDPPRAATTSVEHLPVRVHAGAPPEGLDAVQARIDARYTDEPVPTKATVALAAGGALLCLSLIGWPNALAVIATLAGAGLLLAAAVRWRGEAQRRTDRHERHAAALAGARERAERATGELDGLRDRLAAAAKRATDDLAAVKSSLTAP